MNQPFTVLGFDSIIFWASSTVIDAAARDLEVGFLDFGEGLAFGIGARDFFDCAPVCGIDAGGFADAGARAFDGCKSV